MTHHLTPEHATANDIAQLGRRVANDGFAPHEADIRELVGFVERSQVQLVAAEVLGDRLEPSAARGRALGKICQHWDDIVAAQTSHDDFDATFQTLLEHWNQHRSQRDQVGLEALWSSRAELDALRLDAARARRRLVAG